MRLWSIHPQYLDRQGLIALWRESLLAQKVLAGQTKGYRHHPQLIRFQETKKPMAFIGRYLWIVAEEATRRGYKFNKSKIMVRRKVGFLAVTQGQLKYERLHLLRKLKVRDPQLRLSVSKEKILKPHPLFRSVVGDIQDWERL